MLLSEIREKMKQIESNYLFLKQIGINQAYIGYSIHCQALLLNSCASPEVFKRFFSTHISMDF